MRHTRIRKSGWCSGHQSRLPLLLQMLYVGWVSVDLNLTSRVFSGHSGFLPPQNRLPVKSIWLWCCAPRSHLDRIAAARGALVCFLSAASLLYFATAISSDSYCYLFMLYSAPRLPCCWAMSVLFPGQLGWYAKMKQRNKTSHSQRPFSTLWKYSGCGWSCVYACQPKPHKGCVLNLVLSTFSREVNIWLLFGLYFEKEASYLSEILTGQLLRLYEYEMLIVTELCTYFTAFLNNRQQPASD